MSPVPYRAELISGTVAASGNTSATPIVVQWAKEATFFIDVTALTASQTLDVVIKTYNAGGDKWHKLAEWTQFTAVGTDEGFIGYGLGEKLAVFYTLSGGSCTFSVNALLKEF